MASVNPISDVLSAAPSPVLVPQPNSTLTVPATSTTTAASPVATATAQTPPLTSVSDPPLNVVLDALATASFNASIDQTLLSAQTVTSSGAYSSFLDELITALAAQQTTSTTTTGQSTATTPNSALESGVQALATQVQAATSADTLSVLDSTTGNSSSASTLAPLQQSFDNLIAVAGGSPNATALPTFLQALANNLRAATSPLGNIVNSST